MSARHAPASPPRGCPLPSPVGWYASEVVLARRSALDGRLPDPVPVTIPHIIRRPGAYAHVFRPDAVLIAAVHPGEPVAIQTADCFGGRVTREDRVPSEVLGEALLNPLTGPIWIAGAAPGDTFVAVRGNSVHVNKEDRMATTAASRVACGLLPLMATGDARDQQQ